MNIVYSPPKALLLSSLLSFASEVSFAEPLALALVFLSDAGVVEAFLVLTDCSFLVGVGFALVRFFLGCLFQYQN